MEKHKAMFPDVTFIKILFLLSACFFFINSASAQSSNSNNGWISIGARSTVSAFDHDGAGIGTGGQLRVQFSNRVNTDWFADYITINVDDVARSEYYHVGWSVLFYPFSSMQYPKLMQPYILAGHCFDYNKKTLLKNPDVSRDRLGSAIQAGLGTHFNLTSRFDVSLMCQYMIHLTGELEVENEEGVTSIVSHNDPGMEGHLLATVSLNYKLFRLWTKKSL